MKRRTERRNISCSSVKTVRGRSNKSRPPIFLRAATIYAGAGLRDKARGPQDAAVTILARECDVLVLGSGSAGLTAALTAASRGLSVIVLEKTEVLGGTSAMSGAGTWIPANHHAAAAGIEDSPEEALTYIRAAAPEGWAETEEALWQRLVAESPAMLRFVEERSPLRFRLTPELDPLRDLPGAKPRGRMLSPLPLTRWRAGRYAFRIRRSTIPEL